MPSAVTHGPARLAAVLTAVFVLGLVTLAGPAAPGAEGATTYDTLFQDPGAVPHEDLRLEQRAIALTDATPAGERIRFAFRDFNRQPVIDALVRAHRRGVDVRGVIDGDERTRARIRALVTAVGADRIVLCGTPSFVFNSCIANTLVPGLQHNKFMTFSHLNDGRSDVVLETSKNFFENQINYYNDMVLVTGDAGLRQHYDQWVADMASQLRSDDYYHPLTSDDGRATMFQSPRPQADLDTDDTIAERLDDVECSTGGSADGRGLIRAANMTFRTERAVILDKLIERKDEGCDVAVVLSNGDGPIIAGLVRAGIPLKLFFLRARPDLVPPRPQVIMHSKFWTVDAGSAEFGGRTKLAYAGSSNWRPDQQDSDDLLLRIRDDAVHDAYAAYWELIRDRAASDQNVPEADGVAPATLLAASPAASASGWNTEPVTLRIVASDGHNVSNSGLAHLRVELTGAHEASHDFLGEETPGYRVEELEVAEEGTTTVSYASEDAFGNLEATKTHEVRIDQTPPTISGVPEGCELWPPDGRMVQIADVLAEDEHSGVADLDVTATSDPQGAPEDVVVHGGEVAVRARKGPDGVARTYTVTAIATDVAGNTTTERGTCTVPQSQGAG